MDILNIEDHYNDHGNSGISNKKLVLVIYDIVSDKRRLKFVKLMESYGVRVQKSAFEMIISELQYEKMLEKIPKHIEKEDNIRVYKLRVNGEIVSWGSGITESKDIIIV